MDKVKYLSIILLSLFPLFTYCTEKRAIIVAVGTYPQNSGWHSLSSVNDAQLMQSVLHIHGFEDKNITTLINENATKARIQQALENTIAQTHEGDVVVFHFSGHGQQITDRNQDELDGYDEAIIPYDAAIRPGSAYKGDKHLIDDELNGYLYRLRKKAGTSGDVIFFLDACHSGTGTRGANDEAIYRGTELKFDLEPQLKKESDGKEKFDEQQRYTERGANDLAPFVLISASGQQELNREIRDQRNKGYGSLSYAIGRVLSGNRGNLTYVAFFDWIRNEMEDRFAGKHRQTPQSEGNFNRQLFAGKAVTIPNHCTVLRQVNSGKVVINMGEFAGVTVGSEIHFYPINTTNLQQAKWIAKGKVTRTGLVESDVHLDYLSGKTPIKESWGFVYSYVRPVKYANVAEMRAEMIRRATAEEPSLRVEIALIKAGKECYEFKYNDQFQLRVTNRGTRDAFFQVIDVQPDNKVSLLFDMGRLSPNDLFLKAGETKTIKYPVTVCEPAGVEVFKLIASPEQIDLSSITTSKPSMKRDNATEFEQMLNELYGSERGASANERFKGIHIFSRSFRVKEK